MELEKLVHVGETLGLSGSELKTYIKEERERMRDERAEERERVKEERELVQIKLELEKTKLTSVEYGNHTGQASGTTSRVPKLPTFVEGKDQIDAYLNRFERYARAQNWPENIWASNLSALLSGKALDTYYRLEESESMNYESVKKALLERFSLNSEGFRKTLRSAKPQSGESASQFVTRMRSYFDNWLKLAGFEQKYEHVVELLLIEQFYNSCSPSMVTFIREHRPKKLTNMIDAAERYVEARSGWHVQSSRDQSSICKFSKSK